MKKSIFLILPLLFLVGCDFFNGTKTSSGEFDFSTGKEIVLDEAKRQFETTVEAMDSLDAFGVGVTDASFYLKQITIVDDVKESETEININDLDLDFKIKGLKETDFTNVDALASVHVKGSFETFDTTSETENTDLMFDLSASTYLDNAKIYVDLSNTQLLNLLSSLNVLSNLEVNKFFTNVEVPTENLPLLPNGTISTYYSQLFAIFEDSEINFEAYGELFDVFFQCKNHGNNTYSISLDVTKEKIVTAYSLILDQQALANNVDITASEYLAQKEVAVSELSTNLDKIGFKHIKASIAFDKIGVRLVNVDIDSGTQISQRSTMFDENGELIETVLSDTTITIKTKVSVDFDYGSEVVIKFPSFTDYVLYVENKNPDEEILV